MIKIIKQGTKKTCSCDNCGCLFSYEAEDVDVESYRALDMTQMGSDSYKESVRCPQCGERISLNQIK
jgi:hypothetical protein